MLRRSPALILALGLLVSATAACGSADPGRSTAGTTVTVTVTHAAAAPPAAPVRATTTAPTVTAAATTTTAAPAASTVSFAPFVGEWVGHTRFVTVSKGGRLEEHVGDGCCDPIVDLVLQLSNPRRSGAGWVATSRVVSATVHPGWKQTGRPAPVPGDRGTVRVGADHILVDSITDNGFCDPDRTAPGTCGA